MLLEVDISLRFIIGSTVSMFIINIFTLWLCVRIMQHEAAIRDMIIPSLIIAFVPPLIDFGNTFLEMGLTTTVVPRITGGILLLLFISFPVYFLELEREKRREGYAIGFMWFVFAFAALASIGSVFEEFILGITL